jgi:general secretion pathway protein G
MNGHTKIRRGFTLVEILIVVVILGILASIVIPQFSSASHQARENTLKDDLRYLRVQIQVFKAQHKDVAPGYPGGSVAAAPTESDFVDQMTKYTSESCATSASASTTYKYGPYLSKMPVNPLTNSSSVLIVANGAAIPTPTTDDGWIYKPQTQELYANMTGSDSSGTPYAQY